LSMRDPNHLVQQSELNANLPRGEMTEDHNRNGISLNGATVVVCELELSPLKDSTHGRGSVPSIENVTVNATVLDHLMCDDGWDVAAVANAVEKPGTVIACPDLCTVAAVETVEASWVIPARESWAVAPGELAVQIVKGDLLGRHFE
jgi:hypothetical protein